MNAEYITQYAGYNPEFFAAQVDIVGPWLMLLLSESGGDIGGDIETVLVGELLLMHWSSGEIVIVSLWRLVS